MRDDLDCAPADGTAFALPGEIRDVRFASRTSLAWAPGAPSAGAGTVHDVLEGRLAELPAGSGVNEMCLANGISAATQSVGAVLSGSYYLVRGGNACGAGSYGFTSAGAERTSPACP